MTSQLGCTDMLTEWALPYLERLSSGRVALSAMTTAVRAVTLRDELLLLSDVAVRAWWYCAGWPARIAVRSVDDIAMLVRAGVTNVVEVSFCRCDVPEVYAEAATHFSSTVVGLRDVDLSDTTSEEVMLFQQLRTLHCANVSCGQLRTLSSCLTRLERLGVDAFDAVRAAGVLDDMSELFPALTAFPVLRQLSPRTSNDDGSSLFVLSAARLTLRLLPNVPRWSRNYPAHVEGVLKSFIELFEVELDWMYIYCSHTGPLRHFDRLSEDIVHAIAAMASYVTTPNAVIHLSTMICNHCGAQRENQKILGTSAMREAIVAMSVHATTPRSVERLSFATAQLLRNCMENRRTFGTPAMCDAIVAMSVYATTPDSVESLSLAIAELSCHDEANQRILGTVEVCDAIVAMSVYAKTALAVEWLSRAITELSYHHNDNQRTFGTVAMCDAIVAMSLHATTSVSVGWLSFAIGELASNYEHNQRTVATAVMCGVLVAMSVYATTADSVERLCGAIVAIVQHPENALLFGTAAVRDALVAMSAHVTTGDSVVMCLAAITHLVRHTTTTRTFATPELRSALLAMSEYATRTNTALDLQQVLETVNERLLCFVEGCDVNSE